MAEEDGHFQGGTAESTLPMMDFQQQMVVAVENFAAEIGIAANRQLIEGESENYYILELQRAAISFKVYVYVNEAGFYEGSDWHIHERCDFDSSEELLHSFMSDLANRLVWNGSPPRISRWVAQSRIATSPMGHSRRGAMRGG